MYSLINKKKAKSQSLLGVGNESYLELEVLRDLVGDLVLGILIPISVSRPTSRSNPRPDATNRWCEPPDHLWDCAPT